MSRPLRIAGYIALGIATGLLVATLAIIVLTRTQWGLNKARTFAVAWLADRIEGELTIERLTGPNLLGGVTLHSFAIVDPSGRPFVSADSVEVDYNWRTLLSGRIVLDRVVLHEPVLQLEQLPGDTAWNYEYIFRDTTPQVAEPGRSLILFDNADVLNGTVVIRTPFEPDAPVEVDDTARILLERLPGGLARVLRFDSINSHLNRVIWETPIEPGQLFDIASLSTRGFIQREPVLVRGARGTLTARDTILAFDLQDVTLPGSQANVLGTVIQREGKNILDIRVEGRRFQFRDLQWFYPQLPDEGGGSVIVRIQSQPSGTLFLAEDARIQTPGTNLAGTVGVVMGGDSLYFTRVNLRASPLDVKLLEQLLPGGLPVEGLLIGTIEVSGPISALDMSGDVRVAGGGVGHGSQVSWNGVFDLRDRQISARSLHADVGNLELALINALNPRLRLGGRVSGRIDGSGSLEQLAFQASLTHSGRDGARASFNAGGSVRRDGDAHTLDITGAPTSATFADLARYVPALARLQGDVSGPVRLEGTSRDLRFAAQLATAGGDVTLDGRMTNDGGARRVTARAQGTSFQLSALRPELPELTVTGTVDLDITGPGLAMATGTAQLVVDSARLRNFPLGAFVAGGRIGDGIFTVDSARTDALGGAGRARGTVALVEGREGRLDIGFTSHSLTPLEPFLFRGRAPEPDAEARIAGRIVATGILSGWLRSLDLTAKVGGEGLVYSGATAKRLQADVELRGLRGTAPAPMRIAVSGDSLELWLHRLRTAQLDATGSLDSLRVIAAASDGREDVLHVRADVLDARRDGANLRLTGLRLGAATPWALAAPTTVQLDRGTMHVDALELRRDAGGRLLADGRLAWAGSAETGGLPLDFRLRLEAMPFTEALRALRSNASGAGDLDVTVRVSGTTLDPFVEGELNGRDLRFDDVRIDRAFAELNYGALGLDAHAEAQYGGRSILTGGGRIPIDLRLASMGQRRLNEPLRFTIAADSLPPSLPLSFLDGFSGVEGRIDGRVAFSGTTLEPTLSGGFRVSKGAAEWDATGVRYRDVNGSFTLEADHLLRIDSLSARTPDPRTRGVRSLTLGASEGRGDITGTIDLSRLTDPTFDLRLRADRVFAARRRDVEAIVTGELQLGGRYTRPELSGAVRVERGALYLDEIYRQFQIVSLEDVGAVDTSLVALSPLLGSALANASNPFVRNIWVRNMEVNVAADSWLRSQDMDVEVTGGLTVAFRRAVAEGPGGDRRDADLRLTGTLNVERGTYTLYYPPLQSRRFNVRQGTIDFPGVPGIDPSLSISAGYKARLGSGEPLDVLAVVSGTLQSPRIRLTSENQPLISESDLASYLFFGVPSWEVASTGSGTGPIDVRSFGKGALTPTVLGYASSGLQSLAQSVGILDYAALTSAEVAPDVRRSSGLTSFLAGTQLELGSYLFGWTNVFVGASQPFGTGTSPAIRLEWRFLPEFTLEMFSEDRFARTPSFGLRTESGPSRKVYGLFLFREWGF